MKIFGWEELEKDNVALIEADMDEKDFFSTFRVKDQITSELIINSIIEQVYQKGRWFTNRNEAKKAMMNDLLEDIQWRQRIIEKLKQI